MEVVEDHDQIEHDVLPVDLPLALVPAELVVLHVYHEFLLWRVIGDHVVVGVLLVVLTLHYAGVRTEQLVLLVGGAS